MDNNLEFLFERVTSSLGMLIEYLKHKHKCSDDEQEVKLYSNARKEVLASTANIERAFESLTQLD